ncbi:tail fiber domain-containing protein [Longimicrobium sp.]|uniref:tail fiber domain-containing protein n=1 Tax=Longimicrobium sp. TaxID=2029185 RepID=UPI003B3AF185
MYRFLTRACAALALFLAAAPAAAQSDILLQLRSGSPAGDRFRVDSAGGVVALGQITLGIIPASGAGWRMMWYPSKVAFRAGYADLGGQFDEANIGYYSWAGGALNTAAGIYSFAMGNQNTVEASAQCGMALGSGNKVWGSAGNIGTCGIALGLNNDVMDHAGVAIGQNNTSDGDAAVAIGYTTTADADYSMAFGYRASTNGRTGAKVFGDASTTDSIEAVANNEFAVRAAGGFRFRSNATLTNGCNIAAGGASITCASSVTLKENFLDVDGDDVLARMRRIPVNSWNYIDEGRQSRHMGPFAEDFWREFGLGAEPLAIGHLDIDGVNFAGVKALDARTLGMQDEMQRLRADNESLRAANAALQARDAQMEARIARLEALLAGGAPTP